MVNSGANVRIFDGVLTVDQSYYGITLPNEVRCADYGHYTKTQVIILNRSKLDSHSEWHRRIIAAHEFGHAVGLGHETRVGRCSALMWPNGNDLFDCGTAQPQVDDLTGIWRLYNWGRMW